MIKALFAAIVALFAGIFGLFGHQAPPQPAALVVAQQTTQVPASTTPPTPTLITPPFGVAPGRAAGRPATHQPFAQSRTVATSHSQGLVLGTTTDTNLPTPSIAALQAQIAGLQVEIGQLLNQRTTGYVSSAPPVVTFPGNSIPLSNELPAGTTIGGAPAVTTGTLTNYLPLSGGTVTGSTTIADILPLTTGLLSQTVITPVAAFNGSGAFYNDSQKFIAVGQDGFVRFVYFDNNGYTDLHFVQCTNQDCTTKNDTIVATDTNDVDEPTIVMGSDGKARISYMTNDTPNQLRYIQCMSDDCMSKTDSLVDTGNYYEVSFALDTDDTARIVYNDYNKNLITFAQCHDEACSSVSTSSIDSFSGGNTFGIAVGSDHLARIVDKPTNASALYFIKCTSTDCTSNSSTTVATIASGNAYYINMAMSGDDARIVFSSNYGYQYVECTNATCTGQILTTIDSSTAGYEISIVIGTDGLPRITYDTHGSGQYYVQCTSADCSSKNTATIATTGGHPDSIALSTDGFARILYGSSDHQTLYLARLMTDSGGASISGSSVGTSNSPFGSINTEALILNGTAFSSASTLSPWTTNNSGIYYNGGNVGIGTTTPGAKLQVNGDASAITSIFKANATSPGDITEWQDDSGDVVASVGVNSTSINRRLVIQNVPMNWGDGLTIVRRSDQGADYLLRLKDSSNNNLGGFDGNGDLVMAPLDYVGVGEGALVDPRQDIIGSPSGIGLQTDGAIYFASGGYWRQWTISSNGDLISENGNIVFSSSGSSIGNYNFGQSATTSQIIFENPSATNGQIEFQTTNAGVDQATRLIITNTGNVGVGTTTPYSRLTVFGSDTSGNTGAFLVSNSASTTEFTVFDNGNATLAGTLTQNSDQRLKSNVQSLDASSSLAAIAALNPVTFNWIDQSQGNGTQVGFIAQDVQKIFPELVSTTSPTALTPGGTLGVNYIGFIAPIISAIQALSAEVQSLIAEVQGFANSFTTKQLCVKKSDGMPVCLTGDQLSAMLASSGQTQSNQVQISGGGFVITNSAASSNSAGDGTTTQNLLGSASTTPPVNDTATTTAATSTDTTATSTP